MVHVEDKSLVLDGSQMKFRGFGQKRRKFIQKIAKKSLAQFFDAAHSTKHHKYHIILLLSINTVYKVCIPLSIPVGRYYWKRYPQA